MKNITKLSPFHKCKKFRFSLSRVAIILCAQTWKKCLTVTHNPLTKVSTHHYYYLNSQDAPHAHYIFASKLHNHESISAEKQRNQKMNGIDRAQLSILCFCWMSVEGGLFVRPTTSHVIIHINYYLRLFPVKVESSICQLNGEHVFFFSFCCRCCFLIGGKLQIKMQVYAVNGFPKNTQRRCRSALKCCVDSAVSPGIGRIFFRSRINASRPVEHFSDIHKEYLECEMNEIGNANVMNKINCRVFFFIPICLNSRFSHRHLVELSSPLSPMNWLSRQTPSTPNKTNMHLNI